VGLIIYRNWRYEQELDSLLWKIDYKDIQIPDLPPLSSGQGKASRVRKAHLSLLLLLLLVLGKCCVAGKSILCQSFINPSSRQRVNAFHTFARLVSKHKNGIVTACVIASTESASASENEPGVSQL
jgi:hypothetical protein